MAGVRGTKLTAWMSAHPNSPLQTSYSDQTEEDYDRHAETLAGLVRSDGATMRPEPGHDPLPVGTTEWYGVGGAANPATGMREPERRYPLKGNPSVQFSNTDALSHILRTEGMNIDRQSGRTVNGEVWPPAYAGGWNSPNEHTNEDEVTLDYSDVYRGGSEARDAAMSSAAQRGERAVFDAKRVRDIPVPPR
jgi:hypothetical protein